jgi:peptide/nickel transport system substrate-binding protein
MELTSADVLFTHDAVMNPRNLIQSRLGYDQIDSMRAPDKYTVVAHLKRPYAPFLVLFCAPGNVYPIMPKHILAKYPSVNRLDFNAHPIGSGPYTVVEWRRGDRVILASNKSYWKGEPAIHRIELRFTADNNAMANRLASGDVDAVFNTDSSVVPQLRTIQAVNLALTPLNGQGALIFNTQDPVTADPRVRRALAMGIDAKSMVAKASQGVFSNGNPGRGMFQWAYNPAVLQMPSYDPRGAGKLLDAAGWKLGAGGVRQKNGRPLDVLLINEKGSQAFSIIGNSIQEYERAIGVAVTQKEYVVEQFAAPAQMGGPVYGGKFSVAQYPFLPGDDPDVTDQFACNRIPPAGFNKPRFCDPRMDAALARGVASFDHAKRQAAYNDVQRIVSEKLPMYLMYQIIQVSAWPKWLKHASGAPTTPFWNVAAWSR